MKNKGEEGTSNIIASKDGKLKRERIGGAPRFKIERILQKVKS